MTRRGDELTRLPAMPRPPPSMTPSRSDARRGRPSCSSVQPSAVSASRSSLGAAARRRVPRTSIATTSIRNIDLESTTPTEL
eukprot:4427649-Prymnesium_polylepis.2